MKSRRILPVLVSALLFVSGCKLQPGSQKSSAEGSASSTQSGSTADQSVPAQNNEVGKIRVADMVKNLLHRDPTQEELDGFARLANDPEGARVVLSALVRDSVRRKEILGSLCQDILGRQPTAEEEDLYMSLGGQPGSPGEREEVVGFLASKEVKTRAQQAGMTLPVYVFQKLLKRAPSDLEARTFSKAQRDHALTTIVKAMTLMPEFASATVDRWIELYARGYANAEDRDKAVASLEGGERFEEVIGRLASLTVR